jgi:hypothetical protein
MPSRLYLFISSVGGLGVLIAVFVIFHPGGIVWQFGPLTGAIVGGLIVMFTTGYSGSKKKDVEPWIAGEQMGWTLIGCGSLMWGLGECVWRYYTLTHQNTFPSLADIGYAALPPLFFAGLLLQPSSSSTFYRKLIIVLDCLIAMGSLLSIGWYFLLGSLAQTSSENLLAKALGLYYPITDIGLVSCVIFLLLRGQDRSHLTTARSTALFVLGCGLCLFAASDFLFNVLQNAGTYIDGTWTDLGWPLGILTIGVASYLRRFIPRTTEETLQRRLRKQTQSSLSLAQIITYITLALLLLVLTLNILSSNSMQIVIRPVLLLATIFVIAIVIIRQIVTIIENQRLTRKQTEAIEKLARASRYIEEQSSKIAQHNAELEYGIGHLKDVQARIANGNLRVRATLTSGELLPLAASFNLMADRLTRLGQADVYAGLLVRDINELTTLIEQNSKHLPVILPDSSSQFPQVKRLMYVLHRIGVLQLISSVPFYSSSPDHFSADSAPSTGSLYPQSTDSQHLTDSAL